MVEVEIPTGKKLKPVPGRIISLPGLRRGDHQIVEMDFGRLIGVGGGG
jgi:hypothetical protein